MSNDQSMTLRLDECVHQQAAAETLLPSHH